VKKILVLIAKSKYKENIISKYKVDVILIGTTGMGAAEQVILGSVANNGIHHAHCPVFAIR
jgi:nucleotide-binding universal stress UspA family protein